MYHACDATDLRDKIYALLGMCSDDPGAEGLLADYEISWEKAFQKLIHYCLSDQVLVHVSGETAVIRGKGRVLGNVASVGKGRREWQEINISWVAHLGKLREGSPTYIAQTSAKQVQQGDIICLLGFMEALQLSSGSHFSLLVRSGFLSGQISSVRSLTSHPALFWCGIGVFQRAVQREVITRTS